MAVSVKAIEMSPHLVSSWPLVLLMGNVVVDWWSRSVSPVAICEGEWRKVKGRQPTYCSTLTALLSNTIF